MAAQTPARPVPRPPGDKTPGGQAPWQVTRPHAGAERVGGGVPGSRTHFLCCLSCRAGAAWPVHGARTQTLPPTPRKPLTARLLTGCALREPQAHDAVRLAGCQAEN